MSKGEVAGVRYHSYHVRGSTLLHPVMNLFWEWLVAKVPHWLSSNLLTSAGLVLNIVNGLLFLHYCPTATEEAPGWLYLFACVSAFTYQTLDCIDGKHQFRTGCNNDVAEIFDHAFDAFSNSLLAVEMACMLQIGSHPNLVLVFELATITLFYETQWLNYVTGYMNFGKIDVTEGLLMYCGMLLLTSVYGPHLWMTQAPWIGVELRYLILGFGVITFLSCTVSTLHEIYTARQPTSKATKTGPIVADFGKLPPIYPMVALVGLTVLLWVSPGSDSIYQRPCVFMLIVGAAAAKITTKIITMHIAKAEMTITNTAYLGLLVLLVNSVLGSPLDTLVLCPIILVVSFLDYMRYFWLVTSQVADENGVYILTSPDKKTLWANGTAVGGALTNGVAENDCHGNSSNHH